MCIPFFFAISIYLKPTIWLGCIGLCDFFSNYCIQQNNKSITVFLYLFFVYCFGHAKINMLLTSVSSFAYYSGTVHVLIMMIFIIMQEWV
jgi:hypothetical protein